MGRRVKSYSYWHRGYRIHSLEPLTPEQVADRVTELERIDCIEVPSALRSERWARKMAEPLGFHRDGTPLVPPEE